MNKTGIHKNRHKKKRLIIIKVGIISQRLLNMSLFGYDNPTINSSIVIYDSNCSHKPRGISKPTFYSPKGY